jgi:thioredoxin-like negative regulator of GroEL
MLSRLSSRAVSCVARRAQGQQQHHLQLQQQQQQQQQVRAFSAADSSIEVIKGMEDWKGFMSKDEPQPLVGYFTATWCPPCKQIKPVYEEMAADAGNAGIAFAKIDIDDARDVAEAVGIRSVPTFLFIGKDGQLADHFAGADAQQLEEKIAKLKDQL